MSGHASCSRGRAMWKVVSLGAVILAACGDGSSTSTSSSHSSSSSSSSSVGGAGGSTGPGGAGGEGGIEPLPPVPQACASPAIAPGLTVSTTERFDAVSLAWTGTSAALLYAESTGALTWAVKLQRLDGMAMAVGAPIPLADLVLADGGVGPLPRPVVSFAARGAMFVACWSDTTGLSCATIDDDGNVASGLTVAGERPAIAMGPAGVGLVYVSDEELRAQLLAGDATAQGDSQLVATSSIAPFPALPVLSASSVGYVASADVFFPRFDASFVEIDGAAASGWTSLPVALAGSGDIIGAAWGSLDGVQARVLGPSDDDFQAAVRIDGGQGSTSAFTTALARADASFASLWSEDFDLRYVALDLAAQPRSMPLDVLPISGRSESLALSGVADGFVAAAATGTTQDEIVLVRLACP